MNNTDNSSYYIDRCEAGLDRLKKRDQSQAVELEKHFNAAFDIKDDFLFIRKLRIVNNSINNALDRIEMD